jgi:hypothetical protein
MNRVLTENSMTARTRKKIPYDVAIRWFVLVPVVIVIVSLVIILPTRLIFDFPAVGIPSYKTAEDVLPILSINLQNSSENDGERTFLVTWKVAYNILDNSSRQPPRFSLAQASPGWSGFAVSLSESAPENTTYFLKTGNDWTWADYKSWTFSYESVVSLEWNSVTFPLDTFESSMIYVWTSDGFYPQIELDAPKIPGFVVYLKSFGLQEPTKAYESFSISQRMGIGLPSIQPLSFKVMIQRDASFVSLYLLYFSFMFFLIYYIGTLSYLSRLDVEKKIGIFASLSVSIIAFIWTMRQIAGDISYVEIVLLIQLFGWVFLEVLSNTELSPLKKVIEKAKAKLHLAKSKSQIG